MKPDHCTCGQTQPLPPDVLAAIMGGRPDASAPPTEVCPAEACLQRERQRTAEHRNRLRGRR